MMKLLTGMVIACTISIVTASLLQETIIPSSDDGSTKPIVVAKASTNTKPKPRSTQRTLIGKTARLKMDPRGHFVTKARMNGRSVEVLVDTGATSVAINSQTARRLGITLKPSDFKYTVNTANGKTKAAQAVIEKIQIGKITVRNVRAAVLKGKSLDGTLLGMTFLGQLSEFKIANGELIMRQ